MWARPPRFLLGPAHARPHATHASPLSLPPGPARSVGARPHDAVPRCVALPRPDPPLFSFPLCRADDRAAQSVTVPTRSPISTPLRLLLLSTRASPPLPTPRPPPPTTGHRQPTLPHGFRPSTAAVHHSPVSSSLSYQSLQFLAIFSPSCLSGAAGPHTRRCHPPEPPPHRRTSSPDAVCTASPSTHRSGGPLPSPPCPAPSP
jgi:hypothetical protein